MLLCIKSILDILTFRLRKISKIKILKKNIILSGGVASNNYLRENLDIFSKKMGFRIYFPPVNLCTDNAVMIGYIAIERIKRKIINRINIDIKLFWCIEKLYNRYMKFTYFWR